MNEELLEALRTLVRENLGDWIYDVRDRVSGLDENYDNDDFNPWEHPRVKAFSDAVAVIERIVKEYGE